MSITTLPAQKIITTLANMHNLKDDATIGQLQEAVAANPITVAQLVDKIRQEQCEAPNKPLNEMTNDELRKVKIVDLLEPLAHGGSVEYVNTGGEQYKPLHIPADSTLPFLRSLDTVLNREYKIMTVGDLLDRQQAKKDVTKTDASNKALSLEDIDNIFKSAIKRVSSDDLNSEIGSGSNPVATPEVIEHLKVIKKALTIDINASHFDKQEENFYNQIRGLEKLKKSVQQNHEDKKQTLLKAMGSPSETTGEVDSVGTNQELRSVA